MTEDELYDVLEAAREYRRAFGAAADAVASGASTDAPGLVLAAAREALFAAIKVLD